ncbi:NADH-quinone oxidoreductase subunit L [Humibacillus xanthopallidus]|uniref:NADH-quinone oxidoreductase subunit L n=1 Tax=Humibacillus xanthopallidus TaxID=412689 RepID=A0A543PN22_9MICO|nr:proton-conducting transporter membrane subunit [Humibacillus xanthopallidus]TQN45482.1 NADH-quinone oxidoreductase subunit L [Humibacillus xanthopallidus]
MSWIVRMIVVLPALAALAGLLARRQRLLAAGIAIGMSAYVAVLAFIQWVAPARTADIESIGRLSTGALQVPLHLLSDRLSGLVALAVAVVVLAIQVFTAWYLRDDPRYGQFAATVSLFATGMLLLVQASDLVLILVGWEIMGWCSWLLIGHDSQRPEARRAAYKAFIVTRVADIGMVVGLVALAVRAGSTDLITVLTASGHDTALTVGLVGVIIGVAGKSGLIPFHDWLPDAMEGPTPASALIHAATMVAAGSYVIARLFSLYASHDGARTLLAVLASATMVYAALLAFAQTDLKRMLAYSTLSQIAIMLAALAAAPPDIGFAPAIGHLVAHAFFKALLFLGAGWLSVLAGATALAALRGRLHGTGALRWSIGLGLAALAGVPPLIGFFTKDSVIETSIEGATGGGGARAWLVVVALFVTVVLTATYCARAWLLLDTPLAAAEPQSGGSPNAATGSDVPEAVVVAEEDLAVVTAADSADDAEVERVHAHGHAPITLSAALAVATLAALTVFGTLLLFSLTGALKPGIVSALLSLLLVVGAAYAVWTLSDRGRHDVADRVPSHVRDRAVRGFGADTAYVGVGRAVTAVARLVVALDRDVVDAYPRATVVAARGLGRVGERSHRGVPSLSLLALLAGVVVIAVLGVTAWR